MVLPYSRGVYPTSEIPTRDPKEVRAFLSASNGNCTDMNDTSYSGPFSCPGYVTPSNKCGRPDYQEMGRQWPSYHGLHHELRRAFAYERVLWLVRIRHWNLMTSRLKIGKVFRSEIRRHAFIQQGFNHLALHRSDLYTKRGNGPIIRHGAEPCEVCRQQTDPSIDFK